MKGICKICKKEFNYYPSNKSGKYCSLICAYKCPIRKESISKSNKGKIISKESREKMSKARKGKKHSPEHIKKRFESFKLFWDKKGRKSTEYASIKSSNKYRQWRKTVFERDNYTCQKCGDKKGGNLEAEHIIPFASLLYESKLTGNKKIIFDVENGLTLCTNCHKKTSTYSVRSTKQTEYKLVDAVYKLWSNNTNKSIDFDTFWKKWIDKKCSEIKDLLP